MPVAIWTVNVAEPPAAILEGNEPTSAKPVGRERLVRSRLPLPMLETVKVSSGAASFGLAVPKSMGVVRPSAT